MTSSASQRKYAKRIREERKAAGLCIGCGKVPPKLRLVRCFKCNETQREHQRKQREERYKLGLCDKCDKPRLEGLSRCKDHLEEQRGFANKRHKTLREAAIEAYGGPKCNCCGSIYKATLELDHVNGGGNKHRAEVGKTTTAVCKWLRDNNYPEGLMQVLCASCNKAKHLDGICRCKEHHVLIPNSSIDNGK